MKEFSAALRAKVPAIEYALPLEVGTGMSISARNSDQSRRPIRVLHSPTLVGGNCQTLAVAERSLGVASWVVSLEDSSFGYPADEILYGPKDRWWTKEPRRWKLLWRAVRDFDIIHFNFGATILPRWCPTESATGQRLTMADRLRRLLEMQDLRWLRALGKGIIVTFQGDDARQGDESLKRFECSIAGEVDAGYYPPLSDERKRWRIRQFDQHADRIFALNPDLLHVLPARSEFLPYCNINLQDWRPTTYSGADSSRPLTLLHAPSHRGAKGTRHVLAAVERLRSVDGLRFDFNLVEKLTNSEARKLYERADLLVDQLLAGWYGGLAVELMALGKPVICYLRECDLHFIPPGMRADLPLIPARPDNIYDVLKQWLQAPRSRLAELGQKSRAFVERWHQPVQIAQHLKSVYESILPGRAARSA